jgi:predicted MFS family arabinose efflux permease
MSRVSGILRTFTIGLTAFLTVVDLFATQAILPPLAHAYGVTPAAMGSIVGVGLMNSLMSSSQQFGDGVN